MKSQCVGMPGNALLISNMLVRQRTSHAVDVYINKVLCTLCQAILGQIKSRDMAMQDPGTQAKQTSASQPAPLHCRLELVEGWQGLRRAFIPGAKITIIRGLDHAASPESLTQLQHHWQAVGRGVRIL